MSHVFLSDDWFEAVEGLRDEMPEPPAAAKGLKVNIVVSGGPDQSAGMQAFMSGQIKVEGDMTKLMAMQGAAGGATAEQKALQEKLKALTA